MVSYSQQSKINDLILNIAPVKITAEKVKIGKLPFTTADDYKALREKHWNTHAFRSNQETDEIFNVALSENLEPLGSSEEVLVSDHLYLIARAIQRKILVWLAGR